MSLLPFQEGPGDPAQSGAEHLSGFVTRSPALSYTLLVTTEPVGAKAYRHICQAPTGQRGGEQDGESGSAPPHPH